MFLLIWEGFVGKLKFEMQNKVVVNLLDLFFHYSSSSAHFELSSQCFFQRPRTPMSVIAINLW